MNSQGTLSREAFQKHVKDELDSFRKQVVDGLANMAEALKGATPEMLANAATLLKINASTTAAAPISPAAGTTETPKPVVKRSWWQWIKAKCSAAWKHVKDWAKEYPFTTALVCGVVTIAVEIAIALTFPVMNTVGPFLAMTVASGIFTGILLDPVKEDGSNDEPLAILAYVVVRALISSSFGMNSVLVLLFGLVSFGTVVMAKVISEDRASKTVKPAAEPMVAAAAA